MLTEHQIRIVRESYYSLQPEIDDVAATFYARVFAVVPETRALFGNVAAQRFKLAAMLTLVVSSLDRIDSFLPIVRALGARHNTYGVRVEYFEPFGQCLLYALQKHSAQWSVDKQAAWQRAWNVLAQAMLEGLTAAAE